MNLHANAALSLNKRRDLCQRVELESWTLTQAAAAAEVSVRCARKWVGRYRTDGELGLLDRSSAPHSIPHRTSEERVQAIAALRRLRFTGPEIAETLSMALSTVSGILTRIGMGRLGRLGLEPARRYERQQPGELVHIDVKKLGRIQGGAGKRVTGKPRHNWERSDRSGTRRKMVGWECVHIAIDDCTRLAYAEVLPDERASTAVTFLRRARAFYRRHGIEIETAAPISRSRMPWPVARWASSTCAPAPTGPKRMGRRRDSSALSSAAGPTARSTAQQRAHGCPQRMAVVLQPSTKTLSSRPQAPDRSTHRANQPSRYLHLGPQARGA